MKKGSKVILKDRTGLSGFSFYRRLKYFIRKNKYLTIRHVKPTGAVMFEGFTIGYNMFGEEQGLKTHHLKSYKKKLKTT